MKVAMKLVQGGAYLEITELPDLAPGERVHIYRGPPEWIGTQCKWLTTRQLQQIVREAEHQIAKLRPDNTVPLFQELVAGVRAVYETRNSQAILDAAYTDYECAKSEDEE